MLKINDLLIGLANTSANYGVLKSNSLTSSTLNELWEIGFRTVDTSESYSNADNILIQSGQRWRIQNKITLPESKLDFEKIGLKLKMINKSGDIQSLLVHTPDLYSYEDNSKILRTLKELSLQANIPRFGISIYRPIELENLENLDSIDLIQFPHNPMDTACANWCFQNLPKHQKILQARSIFLQGLLVSPETKKVNYPQELRESLAEWRSWLKLNDLNSWEFCVDFVFQDTRIDQVIFGLESSKQAINIISRLGSTSMNMEYPFTINPELTDPRSWKN
jgi:aryl-alcohol dehydrogenase-like predicted oxidoreductase